MEDNFKPIVNRNVLFFKSETTIQQIWPSVINLRLKPTIIDARKSCKAIISQPTLRSDNEKAALTNHHLYKNRNIGSKHLGGKGLYLNPHGTARLTLNLKSTIRKLWSKFGNLGNPGYQINLHLLVLITTTSKSYITITKTKLRSQPFLFNKQNDKSCENSNRSNATEILRNLRLENPNQIMIGQLNINSIRNKFEKLTSLITKEIDVLLLSETKIE